MKNVYLIILLIFTSSAIFAQNRSINRFINKHKKQDHAIAVSVPGWLLDMVGYSANFLDDDDQEAKEILQLTNKISRIRVLVVEESAVVDTKSLNNLRKGLMKSEFEELITVKSEDANIQLMIKEKRNKIRNLTAIIQSDDSLVFMTLSGHFKLDDIKKLSIWDEINEENPLSI